MVVTWVDYNRLSSGIGIENGAVALIAADGKKYLTDTFDYDGIIELAKNFPSKKANHFIEWFTYSVENQGNG